MRLGPLQLADEAARPMEGVRRMRYVRIQTNDVIFDVDRKTREIFPYLLFTNELDLLVNETT